MSKTAERFRQSVAEVKQMAGEVQRQLDATRQELRRGVFELPEETSEAASAMRRVVSDQIKALKELTAVVTASGADFDVAERAPATARFEPARNVEASRIADSLRDDDGQLLIAAPAAAEPARSVQPQRPRAPQPPMGAPPMPPSISERNQSGWLSNLLAAASRDEAPPAPGRAANEALEGISLDIAKFVDAEAAAEMWDRWRGGDTSAVSRRLYTAQGQQTFDEIRRKYRSDPQFQDFRSRATPRSSNDFSPRSARTTVTAHSPARRCCRTPARSIRCSRTPRVGWDRSRSGEARRRAPASAPCRARSISAPRRTRRSAS